MGPPHHCLCLRSPCHAVIVYGKGKERGAQELCARRLVRIRKKGKEWGHTKRRDCRMVVCVCVHFWVVSLGNGERRWRRPACAGCGWVVVAQWCWEASSLLSLCSCCCMLMGKVRVVW